MRKAMAILAIIMLAYSCGQPTIIPENPPTAAVEDTVTDMTPPSIESYDMSGIPCGTIAAGSNRPVLVIRTDDGKILNVTLPGWVWDACGNLGDRVGNCSDADTTGGRR